MAERPPNSEVFGKSGRQHGQRQIGCDTFKNHSMLSDGERKLWEVLIQKEAASKCIGPQPTSTPANP